MRTRYNYGGKYSYGGRYKNGGGPLQSLMKRYDNGTGSVTNGDEEEKKERRLVQSVYGSGEDRITQTDILANPGRDPFREYIPGEMGMRAKKMDTPGYFLVPGYTDEQRMKDIDAGRKIRDDQTYIVEVMPDGSKRAVSFYDMMDEFTTGKEGETRADILEAMDIGINRTEEGFSLPSKQEQIRALMEKRENYGLGNIGLKDLQKELGINVPDLEEGDYRDMLNEAVKRRMSSQVSSARASRGQ